MSTGRPGVMFYFDVLPALEKLPTEKVGMLFLAAMKYAQAAEVPSFKDPILDFAWALLRPAIDHDGERYEDKRTRGEWLTYCRECKRDNIEPMDFVTYRQRTVNDAIRSDTDTLPTTSTSTSTATATSTSTATASNKKAADKPPARPRFSPPTVDEVKAFCVGKGYNIDAEAFVAYYESNGWKVGKNPMKSWEQAVITWSKRGWERHGADRQHSGAAKKQWSIVYDV